jgi:hypothetical protein
LPHQKLLETWVFPHERLYSRFGERIVTADDQVQSSVTLTRFTVWRICSGWEARVDLRYRGDGVPKELLKGIE